MRCSLGEGGELDEMAIADGAGYLAAMPHVFLQRARRSRSTKSRLEIICQGDRSSE